MSDRGRACSSPLTLARTPIGRQADSAAAAFSWSARSAARLVNRRVHLPRNRRAVEILARARPRSESITSITIPIPHQIAHARARVLVVVHDLSSGYARVSGDADVVSAKGPRCRACGA